MNRLLWLIIPSVLLAKEATVEQLFSVQTVKVMKTENAKQTSNYGYVKEDESRVYIIAPRFGGYVLKLHTDKTYAKVKKGDPLITVYSPEVFKAKEEYLNAYRYTRQRPNKGMLESSRLKLSLLGISDSEIEAVITSGTATESTTIYAPEDGFIFKKNIEKGAAFNAKMPLFRLVNLDEVWIDTKIYEEQTEDLKKVEKFEIGFKGIEKKYESTVSFLHPMLEPKDATFTLRISLKNDGRLFPGMYATVQSVSQTQEGLILPRTAVIRKNGRYYVFLTGDFKGEHEPRQIEVKVLDAETYRVTKGLNEGDEVVNNALFMMDSDAQINSLY